MGDIVINIEDGNLYIPLFRSIVIDYKSILKIYHYLLRKFYEGETICKFNIGYLKKVINDTKQINRIIGIDDITEIELLSFYKNLRKISEEFVANTSISDINLEHFIITDCYICLNYLKVMYGGINQIYYELAETSLALTNLCHIPKEKTYTM